MDSKYILTPSGTFVSTDELYHHGIKGMKWGVRRYQNADGTLTAAGKKRYANPDGSLNEKGKKKFGDSVVTAEKAKASSKTSSEDSDSTKKRQEASEMSDKELKDRVNRLRNEDAYKDLSKKLGYDIPKTELDATIAEMEKQKKYLELQRDIKNLTPKQVSKGKQIVDTLMKKVIEPAATEAGKKLLTQYLTEAGAQVLGKTAKKEAEKIEETVEKSAERVKEKEAKKEAKSEKQQAKQESKQETEQQTKAKTESKAESKAAKGTVEGTGNSSKKSSNSESSSSKTTKETIDLHQNSDGVYEYANTSVTDLATSRNTSAGRTWVSAYLSSGKDDDD